MHPLIKTELLLENGEVFTGMGPTWKQEATYGEVVFTTGMTGYPESMTDPSYTGQILCFTYPLIGNYGIPPKSNWESTKIHLKGVIVSQSCLQWSHHLGTQSLFEWLQEQKVPFMTGVDTRTLTKILRSHGTMKGVMTTNKNLKPRFQDPNEEHLVSQASIKEKKEYGKGKKVVIAIDCGMKENIVRNFEKLPITLKRVPYHTDLTDEEYDGIFISNGPGDPIRCKETISILKKALKKDKPIFGICLGTQLLALAAGAKTYKLPFGHRGQNQPCIDTETEACYITSQNHGYAVDENSLSKSWKVIYKNLNDGTVEGIAHREKPFFAVQFHPEATPGPTDTQWLFEKFYQTL